MQEILPILEEALQHHPNITFQVLNPDYRSGSYAGTPVKAGNTLYLYRSLRAWMELAELLGCRMHLPRRAGEYLMQLTFEKLAHDSFHETEAKEREEKYGSDSHFAKLHKMEEPAFFYYYRQALHNVAVERRKYILNLGINRGDEFEVIRSMVGPTAYQNMELTGIDYAQSAIDCAQKRFPEANSSFYAEDINAIEDLKLGKFDLCISIGTLQSPGIRFKPFLMYLVQHLLTEESALILGFPNSRWRDGEMLYGAKVPNYAMSEMGHLFNDVMFAKKYLQQKRYRVTLTGKQYIFLTATKIRGALSYH
jgi:hypothetical protein